MVYSEHDAGRREHVQFDEEKGAKRVIVLDENGNQITSFGTPDGATASKQDALLAELAAKTEPADIQTTELIPVLRALLVAITNPPYIDKSINAIRNQVQSGTITTVTTVTTVTTLTGLTNFGSFPADHLQRMANMTAWATNTRSLIT